MTGADPKMLAADAGLTYTLDGAPGYRRIRRGKGFSYVDREGEPINGRARDRIEALAIPPAWTDVWISPDDTGHIQATGFDKAGRKQYVYHPAWEDIRAEVKFDRMEAFGGRISTLRRTVDADLRKRGLPKERVVALAVGVLDRTLIRVGNRRYTEENDSYGLTTLTTDHVDVSGVHVHLEFEGKGGADHQVVFRDRRLARLVASCEELQGETLFSYQTPEGVAAVTPGDVNRYLARTMGSRFTAKDFRTWGATTGLVGHLVDGDGPADPERKLLDAVDRVAERMGNTRAVCRDSYLHPEVVEAHRDGRLHDAWRRARPGRWVDRTESAVNRILGDER